MAGKRANVDFTTCSPDTCDPIGGFCRAIDSCTHGLLEQEDANDSPMLTSVTMCVGCSNCVKACPVGAITIEYR